MECATALKQLLDQVSAVVGCPYNGTNQNSDPNNRCLSLRISHRLLIL